MFYALPRCCFLGDYCFREPTIGHEIWLDNAARIYDEDDETTLFFLRAYALSKNDADELVDWNDIKGLRKQMKKFMKDVLGKFTVRQIVTCMNYCIFGADAAEGEQPAPRDKDGKDEDKESEYDTSIAIGVVHEAMGLGLGISIKDACRMTASGLQAVIERAYADKGIDRQKEIKDQARGDYYRTLEEIKSKKAE